MAATERKIQTRATKTLQEKYNCTIYGQQSGQICLFVCLFEHSPETSANHAAAHPACQVVTTT
jgi:hypothetical protein